ncbi:MAG: hypothetical protein RBS72_06730 [Sedimentisphaerales bacterium]|jgi:hypothetical protein|nr:hypothetical protein [Sedimentisphaerales bacterium]NLZ04429.1 hypothetical protein [Phycisphaerae bacterium]HNY77980.1 hypothetical protein [Sedimentisphaerales bacterium]HOC63376.1 hypothetical protein [Sedimentisphaerales bacterium]HOH64094.1 hypothetical protein [Sedimentisphaerales bacterium]
MTTDKERIEELLRAFPKRGLEPVRPGLLQELKNRIPHRLIAHRMDTVNIIVDLRISRIAAAAAILIALVIAGGIFGGREALSRRTYQDGKTFLKYTFAGEGVYRTEVLEGLQNMRDSLLAQGREVVYYGDRASLNNPHVVLMHWKLDEDRYGVILGDLSARTVSGKTLIRLQAYMLKEQRK